MLALARWTEGRQRPYVTYQVPFYSSNPLCNIYSFLSDLYCPETELRVPRGPNMDSYTRVHSNTPQVVMTALFSVALIAVLLTASPGVPLALLVAVWGLVGLVGGPVMGPLPIEHAAEARTRTAIELISDTRARRPSHFACSCISFPTHPECSAEANTPSNQIDSKNQSNGGAQMTFPIHANASTTILNVVGAIVSFLQARNSPRNTS